MAQSLKGSIVSKAILLVSLILISVGGILMVKKQQMRWTKQGAHLLL
jgi:hypothetical protein